MWKLAVVISEFVQGAAFREALEFVRSIRASNVSTQVVFSYPIDKYDQYFNDFVRTNLTDVEIRGFSIEIVSRKYIRSFFGLRGDNSNFLYPNDFYARPRDGVGGFDFMDCDFWFFWNAPRLAPISPLRPYALRHDETAVRSPFVTHPSNDLALPKAYQSDDDVSIKARIWSHRAASISIANSKSAEDELVTFCGVRRQNIVRLKPVTNHLNIIIGGSNQKQLLDGNYLLVPLLYGMAKELDYIAGVIDHYTMSKLSVSRVFFFGEYCREITRSYDGKYNRRSLVPEFHDSNHTDVPLGQRNKVDRHAPHIENFRERIFGWTREQAAKVSFFDDTDARFRVDMVSGASLVWVPSHRADRDLLSVEAASLGIPVVAPASRLFLDRSDQYGVTFEKVHDCEPRGVAEILLACTNGSTRHISSEAKAHQFQPSDVDGVLRRFQEYL